ncbi:MAG: glycosyltransferase family 2 protein [Micrococcales bacterium]|nr:glycosyltransferase family 2 protein [Micrococcales bacterium]
MREKDTRREMTAGEMTPGVSVVVPAYNEETLIVTSVRAMLALRYPRHEVVVVDDGSTDGTLAALTRAFDLVEVPHRATGEIPVRVAVRRVLVPRNGHTPLLVVSKDNSGRSEAINVGINAARQEIVVITDADSVLEPDALVRVTQPFIDDPLRVVAAGGTVRAVNGSKVMSGRLVRLQMPRSWLARAQVMEYLRSFLIGRTGWAAVDTLLLISGAFGVYRRDVVIEAGGLDPDSIGEDFELCLKVHRMMRDAGREYRMVFVPEPVCWTEVPTTLAVLHRQRKRWHRGLWETLWAYRGMLFRRRYGRIGWLGLPYYWAFELVAPLLEVVGIVVVPLGLVFGAVNVRFALLLLLVAYGYAILVTLAAMSVEEWAFHRYERWRDLAVAVVATVFENVGYRQLTVWWRLEGWWASLRGTQQVWGVMTRAGFEEDTA